MKINFTYWPSSEKEQKQLLENAVTTEFLNFINCIAHEAENLKYPLFVVGGFVRDLLLGVPISDIDLVVEGSALELAENYKRKYGGKVVLHTKFDTASIYLHGVNPQEETLTVDIASARREHYQHPGSLPDVSRSVIKEDLNRRDISINAIAIRLDGSYFGELHDELGGIDDLKRGLIRVLHSDSFKDDPTRIFRVLRYSVRYGFVISKETRTYIHASRHGVSKLSAQRLRNELNFVLEENDAVIILDKLKKWEILQFIHDKLKLNRKILKRMISIREEGSVIRRRNIKWAFWLMDLSRSEIEQIDDRLHFTSHLKNLVLGVAGLNSHRCDLRYKRPSEITLILDGYTLESIRIMQHLFPKGILHKNLDMYISKWKYLKPITDGCVLRDLGITPGPLYRFILQKLRNAWLDGEINSEAEEQSLLQGIIKKHINR